MINLNICMTIWSGIGLVLFVLVAAIADGTSDYDSRQIIIDYSKFKSKKRIVLWVILCGPVIWCCYSIKFLWQIICWLCKTPFTFLWWLFEKIVLFFVEPDAIKEKCEEIDEQT